MELRNNFLKNILISGSDYSQDVVFEKDLINAQPSTLSNRLIVIADVQVQMDVRQPIVEILKIVDNNPIDQVVQELLKIVV